MPHETDEAEEHNRRAEEQHTNRIFNNYELPPGDLDPKWNDVFRNVPLFDLDAEDRAAAEQWRMQQLWSNVARSGPSVDQLSTGQHHEGTTDEYGDLLMGDSRLEGMTQEDQQRSMDALRQISEGGGYTPQDRAQMNARRLQQGQALRGASAAAIQQQQARGTGGGGAELAARLGSQSNYANANAMADAQIGAAGQQRAMQALQAQGQLGGQMYGQEAQRREALDRYNQSQYDWRRGRGQRNTERDYRQDKDRAGAYQSQYDNRVTAATGYSGHNPYGGSGENSAAENNIANLSGAILSNL